MSTPNDSNELAIEHFRNYLRIRTVQPNPDYGAAVKFLQGSANNIGLEFKSFEVLPGKPFVILTWRGTQPELPSLMLHSHMDVVPVFPEHWIVDPFIGHRSESGDIIGRGAQDMKCVAIQYLEAIRRLKNSGQSFTRTIHVTFSADEEVGSEPMMQFAKSKEFKEMKAGFCLDEGIANPGPEFQVFYAERSMWWVRVACPGRPGHGSQFIENTAAEKFRRIVNRFLDFRDSEEARLRSDPSLSLGQVTTVNLTQVEGGVQPNVVPAELAVIFDIRIPPSTDFAAFEARIADWCREAGDGVTYSFQLKAIKPHITSVDEDNPWWKAFSKACAGLGISIKTDIFPAGTDGRITRQAGVPVLGFSPMNHTPILLHDHNEFLNEKIFLRGIDIYVAIIAALASVPHEQ